MSIFLPIQGGSNLEYYSAVKYAASSGMDITGEPLAGQGQAGLVIATLSSVNAGNALEVGDPAKTPALAGMELEGGEAVTILLEAIDENLAAGAGDC